jgi:magnesium chelatase family protein
VDGFDIYLSPKGLCTKLLVAEKVPQGCPCGYFNHPDRECTCPPGGVQKYLYKISGQLLDRIDLHVEVNTIAFSELSSTQQFEKSFRIRERVIKAREIQEERY